MKDVEKMTMSQIIEEFAKLTGKTVMKFATRGAAERRLLKAREEVQPVEAKAPGSIARIKKLKMSWRDPEVAAARSVKQRVMAALEDEPMVEYKSVTAAFVALGLPLSRHIKFRGELKKKGKLAFKTSDATYPFAIVKKK